MSDKHPDANELPPDGEGLKEVAERFHDQDEIRRGAVDELADEL